MTNEEKVRAAKALYERGKAMNKDKTYTLRDITDEEFVILGKVDMSKTASSTDSKGNWYIQRFKQFNEMLSAFDVLEEFKQLKPKGGEYSFTERNKIFIMMLFREYTDKFEHLKRGNVLATDGSYLLAVYTGVLDIFYDSNANDKLIESVMLKMWNRLNIPQRNMDATLDAVCAQCKKMVQKNVRSVSMGMGVREKLYWQIAFRYAFYDFLYRWDKLYENMEEIRKDEVLTKAGLEAASATPKWEECAEIEFALSSEICTAYEIDPELQRLNEEFDALLGVGKKRPPLVRKVEKKFEDCQRCRNKRMKEIELDVIRQHIPDYIFPEGWDELPPVNFEFMPLKELLETAMGDEKEQREWCPITSIDDLLNRIKHYFP